MRGSTDSLSLTKNTRFPALVVPSQFRSLLCTSPNVENIRSTLAVEHTAEIS